MNDAGRHDESGPIEVRGALAFVVAPVALTALVYAPLLAGKILYNRDLARWVYPVRWFMRDSLRRGEAPWWNPDIGLGFPVLADPLSSVFYPPNLLHALGPLPQTVMLVMLLHLLAGAAGVALLGRAFGMRREAAGIAGVAWALSGFVASLWTNGLRLPAGAWIPWQGLAFVHLARVVCAGRPWRRAAAAAGVAIAGGLLAGDVFVAVMGTGLGIGLAAVWAWGGRRTSSAAVRPGRFWRRLLVAAAVSVAAGVAVGMVGILPAARALGGTEREGGLPTGYAELGSLHPARLLEFAAAGGFGKAWERSPEAPWVRTVLDGRPISMSLYLGGSVLALLLLAWRRPPGSASTGGGSRRHAWVAGLGALAVASLLVAMGRHTPLHAAVRAVFPPLGYMRVPEKYLLAFVPCAALLAGFGAQRLLFAGGRLPWRRVAALGAALLALAALAPGVLPADLAGFVRAGSLHAAAAVAGVGAALLAARRHRRLASWLLAAIVTADLGLGSTHLLNFGDPAMLTEPPPAARAIRADHGGADRPAPRLFRAAAVQQSASRAGGGARELRSIETLRDNVSVPFGIAILPGYEAALPPAITSLLGSRQTNVLRLFAVDYALLPAGPGAGAPPAGLLPLADPLPGVRLYRLAQALPRVFLNFRAEILPAAGARELLLDDAVAGGRRVLLSGGAPLDGPESEPVPCAIEHFSTTRVAARCGSDRPALAVFVEQSAPGWTATVDGAPVPLLVANTLLRAVRVPAGSHLVALAYRPPGLLAGAAISLLGVCALIGLAVRRPRPEM